MYDFVAVECNKKFSVVYGKVSCIEKVFYIYLISNCFKDDLESGAPAVVLDSRIASHLREHQKDGIRFLYQKLKDPGGGVILADEMGLGKSVQTISLIIALLKITVAKNGVFSKKYLLIVPSTLVGNWLFEFSKWIPSSRHLVFQVKKSSDFDKYLCSVRYSPIALLSYEMVACIGDPLMQVQFALVVCDEAHRLKNSNGRMHRLINSLDTERRLLLTGTPLQNNSDELFSLLNLARPGVFGTIGEFRKNLDGTNMCLRELMNDTLLRRTSEVNNQYLPQKCEYIFFCRLSELQRIIYERIREFITNDHLLLIDMLKKLCNHPSLLYQNLKVSCLFIGKLSVFMEMMCSFRECGEKVVIVSNFTKTLDMLETLCHCLYFRTYRLDGSIQQQKRMQIVNDFNSASETNSVFLLSTKAGNGVYIVLHYLTWNPAVDIQAMARIWRDGQTKPCHIYRLVTTGAIDEKILQRQIMKTGLSTVLEVEEIVEFSEEELYDIFKCDATTLCNTHDLMECDCKGCGLLIAERDATDFNEQNVSLAALLQWRHYAHEYPEQFESFKTEAGLSSATLNDVTFAMKIIRNY
uniref:DNA repair and recombination protein RAD54-like n=1 Tax=Syphacia muris TaxID=451379 RepID=A0A0N5AGQ6_9BILA